MIDLPWVVALGLVGFLLLAFLIIGLWIPVAIGLAGLVLIILVRGAGGLQVLATIGYNNVNSFVLTAVPLFVLMGELVLRTGLMTKFYRALSMWVDWLPGKLLHTNVIACAILAAITGSSVATAGAVGSAAIPELSGRGYSKKLLYGTIAAGGTLGILIPPSIIMIVYGALAEQSVAALFVAGIVPGIGITIAFSVYVAVYALLHRELFAHVQSVQVTWRVRLIALRDILPMAFLIVGVVGSIYGGVLTPTEAGAVGVVLTLIAVMVAGEVSVSRLKVAMQNAVNLSAMVVFIVVGAAVFSYGLSQAGVTRGLTSAVSEASISRYVLLAAISLLFIVLGMFIDGISMIYLALPLLLPVVAEAGFDLIWFGVIVVILIEIGQVTPPMGLNLFVIKSVAPESTIASIVRDTLPFVFILLGAVVALVAFPGVTSIL